ncbi:WXG100 family type VII secretion target [Mycolicibacterium sp. P1-18]|uniref:WXG100 family type VII secretion target n=1 Tax=Mycolicibacterium sp. P1-18 TaxID=2024615 RepID=UPI0011F3B8F2|nr:WXG100 family type VII secretion target [Mycolicibacterium sp. P1-18]KAA0098067.1 WXG100 family type VII secretion target [Mycolicibacterium sp. P1-18]
MSELRVTSSVLATVAGELESVTTGLRTGLGSLDGEVSALLGPGWSGEAASAYDAVWRVWHDGARQVVDGLATMSALLEGAAQRYDATDATGAARVAETGL